MIEYFYGEDIYQAREALDKLAGEKQARLRWVDKEDLEERPVAEVLGEAATLFGQEIKVARDVSRWPRGLQEEMKEMFKVTDTSMICVVWDRGKPDRRSVIFKQLQKGGLAFPWPTRQEMVAWVEGYVSKAGGQMEMPAVNLLVERVGYDKWRMKSELDKMLISGQKITVAQIQNTVPGKVGAEIFSALNALAAGRREEAVRSLMWLVVEEGEFYILSMLAYQLRTLLSVRRGIEQGQPAAEIAQEFELKPFVVQKNYSYAQKFELKWLRDGLTRILATDFAIRRGKVDQRTAVTMLILGLAR